MNGLSRFVNSIGAGPKRGEPFVFVICGRNVVAGKFKQCFDTLVAQDVGSWGAVVVDDASTNGFADTVPMPATAIRLGRTLRKFSWGGSVMSGTNRV